MTQQPSLKIGISEEFYMCRGLKFAPISRKQALYGTTTISLLEKYQAEQEAKHQMETARIDAKRGIQELANETEQLNGLGCVALLNAICRKK